MDNNQGIGNVEIVESHFDEKRVIDRIVDSYFSRPGSNENPTQERQIGNGNGNNGNQDGFEEIVGINLPTADFQGGEMAPSVTVVVENEEPIQVSQGEWSPNQQRNNERSSNEGWEDIGNDEILSPSPSPFSGGSCFTEGNHDVL